VRHTPPSRPRGVTLRFTRAPIISDARAFRLGRRRRLRRHRTTFNNQI